MIVVNDGYIFRLKNEIYEDIDCNVIAEICINEMKKGKKNIGYNALKTLRRKITVRTRVC